MSVIIYLNKIARINNYYTLTSRIRQQQMHNLKKQQLLTHMKGKTMARLMGMAKQSKGVRT